MGPAHSTRLLQRRSGRARVLIGRSVLDALREPRIPRAIGHTVRILTIPHDYQPGRIVETAAWVEIDGHVVNVPESAPLIVDSTAGGMQKVTLTVLADSVGYGTAPTPRRELVVRRARAAAARLAEVRRLRRRVRSSSHPTNRHLRGPRP